MKEQKIKYDLLVEILNKMVEEEKLPKDIIDECIKFAEENGTDETDKKEDSEEKTTKDMIAAFTSDLAK